MANNRERMKGFKMTKVQTFWLCLEGLLTLTPFSPCKLVVLFKNTSWFTWLFGSHYVCSCTMNIRLVQHAFCDLDQTTLYFSCLLCGLLVEVPANLSPRFPSASLLFNSRQLFRPSRTWASSSETSSWTTSSSRSEAISRFE